MSITNILNKIFISVFLLLVSLSANSQNWQPMGGGTGWGNALEIYNGELYAGGDYGIRKWNGYSWENVGAGVNGGVWALKAYNGKLVVGGHFTNAGNTGTPFLAQWDGTIWEDLGSAPNSYVRTLTIYGNNLIAGGYFTQCENLPTNHVLQYDGDNFSTLGTGTGGSQGQVMALTSLNGELYAGGFFTTAGGVSAIHIAKWNGTSWSALGSGTNSIVYSLGSYNGNLIAGGLFTTAGGITANRIASWDGTTWSALGAGCGGGFYPYVYSILQYGNDLYAGGLYTTAGGQTVNGIAKWDGSTWSGLGSGFYNGGSNVYGAQAILVYNSELVATGIFSSAGGTSAGNIAKWNGLITGITNNNINIAEEFKLYQNYPNPFNPNTKIKFDIPASDNSVKLIIYNSLGQQVQTLVDKEMNSGSYEIEWNANSLGSGIYYYSLYVNGNKIDTKKMILVK